MTLTMKLFFAQEKKRKVPDYHFEHLVEGLLEVDEEADADFYLDLDPEIEMETLETEILPEGDGEGGVENLELVEPGENAVEDVAAKKNSWKRLPGVSNKINWK